jgi:hypothetical protein
LLDNVFDGGADLNQARRRSSFGLNRLSAHSFHYLPILRPYCPFNRLKEIGIHRTATFLVEREFRGVKRQGVRSRKLTVKLLKLLG